MRIQLDVVQGRGAPQVLMVEAASLDAAREQCRSQGYTVLAARPAGAGGLAWRGLGAATPRFDVPVFVEQLRDLLTAGLSVVEALTTLHAAAQARQQPVVEALLKRLRGGEPLSAALGAEAAFPALLVQLVRASEWTSDLPTALSRYLDHELRVRELRHRITSVAIYPLLLTAVGTLVLLFLLLYVMPRFARVFEGMHGDLPWSAQAMVGWAQWLGGRGPWVLAGCVAALVLLAGSFTSPQLRARLLQAVAGWGPLRTRLRTYFLARWYRATGMLVEGGIPLRQALALAIGLLPPGLQAGGAAVEAGIRDGLSPSDAHSRAGMATPVAEQLLRAGERTGDLGSVLTRIAQFHEAEVSRSLEQTMRALEPLVMVLIGVGVGAVVVLMYMPIFELASALQ
jgi:general secretion pathway protein F